MAANADVFPYTDEQVARVTHAANSALQNIQGDPMPSTTWDAERNEVRSAKIAGVAAVRREGKFPRDLHAMWMDHMAGLGWVYGPEKDLERKTHPCMVPYQDLPVSQRHKDIVFWVLTLALSGAFS